MEEIENYKSPEQFNIAIREARPEDLEGIENFLQRSDIDSLFVPALSDPARGMTIRERVEGKFKNGKWVVAMLGEKVIGCMAIVPAKLTREISPFSKEKPISMGLSVKEWRKNNFWELSTVVVDQKLLKREKVKGVGGSLYEVAKNWVRAKGADDGLVTDSWVGGDMGGFVMAMNAKAYHANDPQKEKTMPDTLMRIYSDPAKRGEDGPPTVIYGIPLDDEDWRFFESQQAEIMSLREEYEKLERLTS
jgi:hypothetical protein